MERIEDTILRSLLYNEEFARKTLPFLKDDYFNQFTDKAIFQEIKGYFNKHSNSPSKEALIIELNDRNDLTEEHFATTTEVLNEAEKEGDVKALRDIMRMVVSGFAPEDEIVDVVYLQQNK